MERAPAAHSSKKRAKRGPPLAIAQLDAPGKQGVESIGMRGGKGGASGRATKHKKGKANTRRERKAAAGRDPGRHTGEQHARTHSTPVGLRGGVMASTISSDSRAGGTHTTSLAL